MKKWLARLRQGLFGAAARQADAMPDTRVDPAPGPHGTVHAAALNQAAAVHARADTGALEQPDLDLAFFHWLAAPHVNGAPASAGMILDELVRLTRSSEDAARLVPRVPAVIPQLLRSLREEDNSAADLARQVAQDPVLVAAVIREVNSPLYRPATPIRNLEGALLLLGQNGLRMLLAQVAFRPVMSVQAGALARQAAPLLWRQAEKCALAANLLAPHRGADPFESYLAGLMHNLGMVVAFRLIDQLLPAAGTLPDDDAFGLELVRIGRQISARIAFEWQLPPPVGRAILQIGGASAPAAPLGAALADADRLSKLCMLAAGGHPAFVHAAATLPEPERQVYERLVAQPDTQDPDALPH